MKTSHRDHTRPYPHHCSRSSQARKTRTKFRWCRRSVSPGRTFHRQKYARNCPIEARPFRSFVNGNPRPSIRARLWPDHISSPKKFLLATQLLPRLALFRSSHNSVSFGNENGGEQADDACGLLRVLRRRIRRVEGANVSALDRLVIHVHVRVST